MYATKRYIYKKEKETKEMKKASEFLLDRQPVVSPQELKDFWGYAHFGIKSIRMFGRESENETVLLKKNMLRKKVKHFLLSLTPSVMMR